MRNAILQIPESRTTAEQRQVLRAAIRQLERADLYLAAVAYMELNDGEAERAISRLRAGVQSLSQYIAESRNRVTD